MIDKNLISKLFFCKEKNIQEFDISDGFNTENTLQGFINIEDGNYYGSTLFNSNQNVFPNNSTQLNGQINQSAQPITSTSNNTSSSSSSNNGGQPPNPYTTYIGGKKLADMIKDGEADQWGNAVHGTQGDQSAALQAEVDGIYNSGMDEFNRQENQMNGNRTTDEANLQSSVDNQGNKLNTEQAGLLSDQATEEQGVMSKLQSAYEDAIRAYNALSQKGGAKYGLGSSMGKYLGEIATQEFYKNQGTLTSKKADSTQAFVQNRTKIKNYITGKLDDLNQYKTEAMASLQKVYQQSLDAINAGRGQLSANKSAAKMSLMTDAINQARNITAQNDTLKQNIFSAAVNSMQTSMGRTLTPSELVTVGTDFGLNLGTSINGYNTAAGTGANGYLYQGKVTDPYAEVLNPNV